MTPNRRALLTAIKICDLAIVTASVIAAVAWISGPNPESWGEVLALRISVENFLFMLAYLAYWHFVLRGVGLYRSYRLAAAKRELRDLATATAIGAIPLVFMAPVFRFEYVTPQFVALFAVFTLIGLGLARRTLRAVGRRLRLYGRNLRNVVVIGVGDATIELSAQLARRNDFGYRVVGVIDCGTGGGGIDPGDALSLVGALVDNGQIDEVFMALPLDTSQALIGRIIAICEEQGITVRLATQVASLYWARALVDEIEGQPIITVHTGPADSPGLLVKRTIDLIGATIGLLFFAPLFLLCAAAIKLDSRGPVLFIQDRAGRGRRPFGLLKFRTMHPGTERRSEWVQDNQDRITAVGRLLRRFRLDELPQLVNVLRGDMNIVGPRPEQPRIFMDLREQIEGYTLRQCVLPGITGWAQINHRYDTSIDDVRVKLEYDLEYIHRQSVLHDLKILIKTLPVVLLRRGAL